MNYILFYIGVIILLRSIFGLIADLIEIHSFKKQLKKYNLLYPNFKINIPTKLKFLCLLKQNFEDCTFNMNMLHYNTTITNLRRIYGEATERKKDDEETHTN